MERVTPTISATVHPTRLAAEAFRRHVAASAGALAAALDRAAAAKSAAA